jgi:hypothetical protein
MRSKPYFQGNRMALPTAIVAKDPGATATHLKTVFSSLGWGSSHALIERVLADITAAFWGDWPGYRANDMRYHDLGHTLQATVCISDLVAGQRRSGDAPEFDQRAALLHDSGFLKQVGDDTGTGAKYTLVHERRSCDFARAYLPRLGVSPAEIEDICAAIGCTGPRNRISALNFRELTARRMACLLVTADYISQMCAPDYAEKLDYLFAEFVEAFDHEAVPAERRPYHTAAELKLKTPDFWTKFVRPMLDTEADAVHRYLSVTGQTNAYLQAIEDNIAEVRRRTQEGLITV